MRRHPSHRSASRISTPPHLPCRRRSDAKFEALQQALARQAATPADRVNGYAELRRVLMAARFDREAALCFEHARALAPDSARWPYLLGHARMRDGDRAGAIKAFEQALTIAPNDTTALIWLAETRLDDGQAEAAGADFERALAASPRSAAASFGAGRAALARQSYQDAVRWMEQALTLEPAASARFTIHWRRPIVRWAIRRERMSICGNAAQRIRRLTTHRCRPTARSSTAR